MAVRVFEIRRSPPKSPVFPCSCLLELAPETSNFRLHLVEEPPPAPAPNQAPAREEGTRETNGPKQNRKLPLIRGEKLVIALWARPICAAYGVSEGVRTTPYWLLFPVLSVTLSCSCLLPRRELKRTGHQPRLLTPNPVDLAAAVQPGLANVRYLGVWVRIIYPSLR